MENVLLIITNPHQGRKENAKKEWKMRSLSERQEVFFKRTMICKSLSDLHFFHQCCFWLLCCSLEHRCDTWYSCQTQSANCLCLSGTPSYSFIAVLYFTVGGEIWLSTQGPLCLLGWLFVLNNQYHWDKLNAAFNIGSKHKKSKYMIFSQYQKL